MTNFNMEDVQRSISRWKSFLDRFVTYEGIGAEYGISTEYGDTTPVLTFTLDAEGGVKYPIELWPEYSEVRIGGPEGREHELPTEITLQSSAQSVIDDISLLIVSANVVAVSIDLDDRHWVRDLLDRLDGQHVPLLIGIADYFDRDFVMESLGYEEIDEDMVSDIMDTIHGYTREIERICENVRREASDVQSRM